jgi:hypothetical protein
MTLPVSGPGPYSQRTDRQPVRDPGGLPYGENQALHAQQQAAPLPQTSQLPTPEAVPFSAPTQAPGQPVTAGADRGPGPNSSVLTQRPAPTGTPLVQALTEAVSQDTSGILSALLVKAMERNV